MSGAHHHTFKTDHRRFFLVGVLLNITYVVIELVYGFHAHSDALLADAAHNFGDVLSLLLAWLALWLAKEPPMGRFTFGFQKGTILASLTNAVLLLVAAMLILIRVFQSWGEKAPVEDKTVLWVAGVGVLVNTATALLFFKGQKEDLNIRGAFLHMAADAAVSLGVVVSALLIGWTGIQQLDTLTTLLIVGVIILSTCGLFRESLFLALDASPKHIDLSTLEKDLLTIPNTRQIKSLHVWSLSTTKTAMTAIISSTAPISPREIETMRRSLSEKYQLEEIILEFQPE